MVSEMLAVNLIPRAVEKNLSSDAILAFFLSGLVFKDELEEIEEYCDALFGVFYEIGGQFVDAATKIKKTIKETVRDKLGVLLYIDQGMYVSYTNQDLFVSLPFRMNNVTFTSC